MILIDPPSGWKYGFPKPYRYHHETTTGLERWLLKNGYPQSLIDQGLAEFCRYVDVPRGERYAVTNVGGMSRKKNNGAK
jgi:hypothetical protein